MKQEEKININLELSDKEYAIEILQQLALTRATIMAVGTTIISELAPDAERAEVLTKKMADSVMPYLKKYVAELEGKYSINDNSIGKD